MLIVVVMVMCVLKVIDVGVMNFPIVIVCVLLWVMRFPLSIPAMSFSSI